MTESIDLFTRNKKVLVIVLVALLILVLPQARTRLSTLSEYQGIHPSFAGVFYKGLMYTPENTWNASACRIHPGSLDFDPDEDAAGLPNLRGEIRDIQIIRDLAYYNVPDAASHILSFGGSSTMPYRTYEWEIEDNEGALHKYKMELWLCSMDLNLWADPDARPWWIVGGNGEQMNKRYSSTTEVWLRMEVGPSWYFEGADETYFGLAYVELADIAQAEGHEDPIMDVIPGSKWAAFSIYHSLGGSMESVISPVEQAQSYQGQLLNPEVFAQEWYIPVTIDEFGTFGYNALAGGYKTNSVQLRMLVHIFVVGEWVVQPEIEHQIETPHESETYRDWMQQLGDWLSKPTTKLGLSTFFLVLVFGALIITLWWFFGSPRRIDES